LSYLETGKANYRGFEDALSERDKPHASAAASGRLPDRPETPDEALVQIERLTKGWLRACEAHWIADDPSKEPEWLGQLADARTRAAMEQRLNTAVGLLVRLCGRAEKLAERLGSAPEKTKSKNKPARGRKGK
jgi:hypothetical protein